MDEFDVKMLLQHQAREFCRRLGAHDFGPWTHFRDPAVPNVRYCRTCDKPQTRPDPRIIAEVVA